MLNNAAGGEGVVLYIHANVQGGFGQCQHGPCWVTLTGAGVRLIIGGIGRLLGPIVLSVSAKGAAGSWLACGTEQVAHVHTVRFIRLD